MVDPVGMVTKIVEVALRIKEAVDIVHQNKEECIQIKKRVNIVRRTLSSRCENEAELMKDPAVRAALEALSEVLGEAFELVMDCQEETNVACLFCKAGKLSQQLCKVDKRISKINLDAGFAIMCYSVHKQNQDKFAAHPPASNPKETKSAGKSLSTYQMLNQNKDDDEHDFLLTEKEDGHCDQAQSPRGYLAGPVPLERMQADCLPQDACNTGSPVPLQEMETYCPPQEHFHDLPLSVAYGHTVDRPCNLLHQIAEVAPKIEMAVETVRKRKEECAEIGRCVNKFNSFLRRFANKEIMEDMEMSDALEKLLETLHHAHKLVTDCQRRNIWPSGKLSKQLRDVLDEMMLDLDDMISIRVRRNNEVSKGFTKFRLFELETATNKFSEENMITQDRLANVYKGVLPDRRKVAIRKFHDRQSEDQKQHIVHYATLFSVLLQHDNIVRLVGYCQETSVEIMASEGNFVPVESRDMMVVEEYMPSGTLHKLIHEKLLEQMYWHTIFRIILGIAQGVAYLHTKNIIHMDLKPGNILLDVYMTPKISGFEISNIVDPEHPAMQMGEIIGTPGYMPQEYVESGVISVKNDVYSFGVLLLDTISGTSTCGEDSIRWAQNRLEGQYLKMSFDPSIRNESQADAVERCICIGQLCVAHEREERPTMAAVVEMLRVSNDKFPTPSNSGSRNAARLLGPI